MEQSQALDIGEFEAVLKDVILPMGLTVNALTLTGSELHLEREPFKIESAGPGKLSALILQDSLAAFLNKQAPGGLRNFQVQLRDGKIFVEASVRMLVEMQASAVCTLRIQDGQTLFVDLESVDLMGVGARNLVQNQLDKINPVLDVNDLPIKATLTSFEIADGKLTLHGDVFAQLKK